MPHGAVNQGYHFCLESTDFDADYKRLLRNAKHLSLTKSEAVAILTGNYVKGTSIFDQIEEQVLIMADDFADGIVKQFPPRSV